eukprot:scaffold43492_cov23-Tisochrysis_lutea.AAC.9
MRRHRAVSRRPAAAAWLRTRCCRPSGRRRRLGQRRVSAWHSAACDAGRALQAAVRRTADLQEPPVNPWEPRLRWVSDRQVRPRPLNTP